jgi:hypothetical protein
LRNEILLNALNMQAPSAAAAIYRFRFGKHGIEVGDVASDNGWPTSVFENFKNWMNDTDRVGVDMLVEYAKARLIPDKPLVTTLADAISERVWKKEFDRATETHPFNRGGVKYTDVLGGIFLARNGWEMRASVIYRDSGRFSRTERRKIDSLTNWLHFFNKQRLLGPDDDYLPLPEELRQQLKPLLGDRPDKALAEEAGITRQAIAKRSQKVFAHYKVRNRDQLRRLFLFGDDAS